MEDDEDAVLGMTWWSGWRSKYEGGEIWNKWARLARRAARGWRGGVDDWRWFEKDQEIGYMGSRHDPSYSCMTIRPARELNNDAGKVDVLEGDAYGLKTKTV